MNYFKIRRGRAFGAGDNISYINLNNLKQKKLINC